MSLLIRILTAVLSALTGVRRLQATLDEHSLVLQDTTERLERIEQLLLIPAAEVIEFSVTVEGHTTEGATTVNITDSQKATLAIKPKTKKGNDATLDGPPAWASSDETIATVVADEGGLSATLTAVRPGTCDVTVTGDADLGEGTKPIVGTLAVSVTPGEAVQIDIEAGEPVDQ